MDVQFILLIFVNAALMIHTKGKAHITRVILKSLPVLSTEPVLLKMAFN